MHEIVIKFLTKTKEEAFRWVNSLKNQSEVVGLHMNRDYTIIKSLSCNSYLKRYIAVSKSKKDTSKYNIKSIPKKKLINNPGFLVNI